jgi:hypothetical protein
MRMFWMPLVIVALFAVDRAYMDGENADQLMSLVRWVGVQVTDWTDDLFSEDRPTLYYGRGRRATCSGRKPRSRGSGGIGTNAKASLLLGGLARGRN